MASSPNKAPGSLRLPVPHLFVGPGQRQGATSPGINNPPSASRVPLLRQRSTLPGNDAEQTGTDGDHAKVSANKSQNQQTQNDRTEAIWVEMQNTLDEIELTAANGLNNVFGPEHSKALQELRNAQIRLAEAWGRSEIDEHIPSGENRNGSASGANDHNRGDFGGDSGVLANDREGIDSSGGPAGGAGRPRLRTKETLQQEKTQLEQDTDNDIELARQRREANDRYFEMVNKGVLDVVNKLDEVAERMKAVENESKEIWNDKDSIESESMG